ncbi:MAG: DMT family transporter [Halothiobacillus sp.]
MSHSAKPLLIRPYVALVFLGLLWGYNWVVMKGGLNDIAALWFGAMRTLAPAVLLLLLLPLLGRSIKPPPLNYVIPLGLLQTAGFVGFMMWALRTGAAGETAVLVFTMPLWLTLMAHVVLHERLSRLQWLALGIAGLGLFLMIAPWHGHLAMAASLFAILSGITWAGGSIWQKRFGHRYPLDLLNVTAWQMLFGGLAILLAAVLFEPWHVNITPHLGWVLFYNIVPAGALGWLLWIYALHNLPTRIAGFGSLMIPTVGVLGAWLQLGERPGQFELIGIGFILLALVLVLLPKRVK